MPDDPAVSVLFSEPKIPQSPLSLVAVTARRCFSALQRAENSSIIRHIDYCTKRHRFQCSSASRKFLNALIDKIAWFVERVSVLFSEPKIPQCIGAPNIEELQRAVSVLFSEPKIPQ